MSLLFSIVPLLVLNLGSYVLIELIDPGAIGSSFWTQLGLLSGLGVVYCSQMLMWLWLGKRYQLSFIYPLMGINYVIAVFVGRVVFKESTSWQVLIGALIISLGVFLITSSPHRDEPSFQEPQ